MTSHVACFPGAWHVSPLLLVLSVCTCDQMQRANFECVCTFHVNNIRRVKTNNSFPGVCVCVFLCFLAGCTDSRERLVIGGEPLSDNTTDWASTSAPCFQSISWARLTSASYSRWESVSISRTLLLKLLYSRRQSSERGWNPRGSRVTPTRSPHNTHSPRNHVQMKVTWCNCPRTLRYKRTCGVWQRLNYAQRCLQNQPVVNRRPQLIKMQMFIQISQSLLCRFQMDSSRVSTLCEQDAAR